MLHIDRKKCHPPKSVDKSRYNRRKYSSNRGERAMNRNLPYMKIAVCTSEVQIGEQIREYVDEFAGKGNAQIQVDVMKNCYRLAKKILNREHYDVICIGKKPSGYRQLYLCLQHPYGRPGNHLFCFRDGTV